MAPATKAKIAGAPADAADPSHRRGDHTMSSLPSGAAVAVRQVKEAPKARGFLHIVRHGAGTNAFYIVSYHQIARTRVRPKPMLAEGTQALLDMLERVGVAFHLRAVRGALEDILCRASANL